MQELNERIHEAAEAIRSKWDRQPKVGVILGTGLGGSLESEIDSARDAAIAAVDSVTGVEVAKFKDK